MIKSDPEVGEKTSSSRWTLVNCAGEGSVMNDSLMMIANG